MLDGLHTNSVAEALDISDSHHWTRQPPRSDRARLRFLNSRNIDLAVLISRLNTTPQILQSILTDKASAPDKVLSQAILKEVIRLWQPRVRRRAHRDFGVQQHWGCTSAAGSASKRQQDPPTTAASAS
ncbi:hypothetical protein ABZ892_31675 [Streptomyces sp. NPDC046924]|uniref:hypothetical protein n=1 Tax=Streptomyces sp. NPDC046924 TaxID=3155136 RepID=UPI003401D0F2